MADGHTIAVHCYSHDYDTIYASLDAYLSDFNRIYELIYDATGVRATCFRFPGGSSTGHNKAIREDVKAEMARRGFVYYDWNVSAADTASNASREAVLMNITGKVSETRYNIVLAHEGKQHTYDALEDVLYNLTVRGFTLAPLTNEVKPYQFD